MTQHRLVVGAVGSPIVAGRVEAGREGAAVGVRARQHVVLVRHVAKALHHGALLIQIIGLLDVVAVAQLVAMKIGDARCDQHALGIVPGSGSDAAASIDGGFVALLLLAEIGMPSMSAGARRLGEVLANPVGAREPAEIPGAGNSAGYEKRHGMLWTCRLALRQ